MLASNLINQLRREFGDIPKTTRKTKNGDGSSTVFNVGEIPIIESSYKIYIDDVLKSESGDYDIDLDSGDVTFASAPTSDAEIKTDYQYAHWRDANWVEAINQSIEELHGRGFFKQVIKTTGLMSLSADVQKYDCPSACIDLYEVLESTTTTTSGDFIKLGVNWSYQQDANVLALGSKPTSTVPLSISYLKRMQTYSATSATLDIKDDWLEIIKKRAGSLFYRSVAGKIAKQGNATIDEGHFSFTNLRAMSNDLLSEFDLSSRRAKPTRPAKDISWHVQGGGVA